MYKNNPKQSHHSTRTLSVFFSLILLCVEGLPLSTVLAYEALPGFTGTQLTGTVKLHGKIPLPSVLIWCFSPTLIIVDEYQMERDGG